MNKSAIALFVLLPLGLASCSSTGGPSGGVLGLVTGGLLGHLVDGESDNNGSSSGGLFGNSNNSSNSSGSGSSVTPLLLGTTTTSSTDPTTGDTTEAIKNQYAVVNANGSNGSNNNEDDFFGRNKGAIVGAAAGAISGMVTDSFRKGEIQKKYDEGYAKAKSDAIKEFYWLKRDAQKAKASSEDNPVQYRYYEVEVPAHTTSDGVFIDKHRRVIEVVE